MWCAACTNETETAPCSGCGDDPRLDARYRLVGLLGRGTQGTTWQALREADGLAFAIKELSLRPGLPAKAIALARREALVLSQIRRPAIPAFVESFETGSGRSRSLWLVQELVVGHTLAEELRRHRYEEGEVLNIVRELAGILGWLHGRSPPIVHRDLKPGNVLRRSDGSLALVDFGAVREALADPDLGGSTVVGTFGYMAPEQFAGDACPESDLYALGVLAVTLLSRREPQSLLRGRDLVWKPYVNVTAPTVALLEGLLEVDPKRRRLRPLPPVAVEGTRPLHDDLHAEDAAAVLPADPGVPRYADPGPAGRWPDPPIPELPTHRAAAPLQRTLVASIVATVGLLLLILAVGVELVAYRPVATRKAAPTMTVREWPDATLFGETGWGLSGGGRKVYGVYRDAITTFEGEPSWRLSPIGDAKDAYGTWMRSIDARPYRGKRIRLSMFTKTEGTTVRADFWARIQAADSPGDGSGLTGNTLPLGAEPDWAFQEIELEVPEGGFSVQYGVGIAGPGQIWFFQPEIEIVGDGPVGSNQL